jgi:hypothetical protein
MGTRRLTKIFALLLLSCGLLVLVACERKSIDQVLADPQHYAHRDVVIVGSVVKSYSVLGFGAYQLDDGTGKLWVVSKEGVPREGARVGVKGTIRDGYNLGDLGTKVMKLPDTVCSGIVMIESGHKLSS